MRLLAFDTATSATVVGLWPDPLEEIIEARDDPTSGERPRHTEALIGYARALLDRAGLTFADVDRIAVGIGPGSFTGLRIGVSTARALSQATGAVLAPVSTLRALAVLREEPPEYGTVVVPVVDARRGEVFVAAWRGEHEVFKPRAMTPEALAELAEHSGAGTRRPWLAVGDGAVRFRDQLVQAGVTVPEEGSPVHRVGAEALCRLGAVAEPAPRRSVLPEYLRAPDAQPR